MANTTLIVGALLIVIGLVGYFGTETESMTALIPAGFGIALGLLGLLARAESRRKHAMHAAAVLGIIGFLGSARGLTLLPQLLGDGDVERPLAVWAQYTMAVLCLLFVALCVRSFIAARKARQLG